MFETRKNWPRFRHFLILVFFLVTRLEDKEAEMKKDYTKLHERNTDLFKTHMDYMERSKNMLGPDRMEQLVNMGSNRARIPNMSLNQLNRLKIILFFYI